jgi:hypothetical protein
MNADKRRSKPTQSAAHICAYLRFHLIFSRLLSVAALLVFSTAVSAAILPPRLGDFYQTKTQQFTPPAGERAVYEEYGFDAGEKAQYAAGERRLEITALRAKDPTGAFGIYEWLRPADGKPVRMGERGVEAGDATFFQYGNYLLILRGAKPDPDPLDAMLGILPRFEHSAPPPLLRQMPAEGLIPNSERYVLGPAVLEKLAPRISPSVAGFHLGTEAQMGEYTAAGGRLRMLLFSYPTPHLARAQMEEFQKLPDVMVKRSGPLIAAVVGQFSRDDAEKLLAHVRYEVTLTMSQLPPSRRDNIGDLILNIMLLCAIIAAFALMAGLGVGGGRFLLARLLPGRRFESAADRDFTRLHLSDK